MKLCNTKYFDILLNLRERVYILLTVRLYFPFCRAVYSGQRQTLDPRTLKTVQAGSLGEEVRRFLNRNGIEWMPGYEAHDIKHAMLGYDACFIDELRMQFFELGNGNRSLPMWTVICFGCLMAPDAWKYFRSDYKRGYRAKQLNNLDLLDRLKLPLVEVREEYGLC